MTSQIKSILHFIVSVGGNIILMDVIPVNYKPYAILVFNLAQVLYAYFDSTYAIQKFGLARK